MQASGAPYRFGNTWKQSIRPLALKCDTGRIWSSWSRLREVTCLQRVSKEQYYLNIATAVASRSTCLRKHYGAVIVKGDEIIATGYNGSPRGEANCCDTGVCYCRTHGLLVSETAAKHGAQYGSCVAVHAEQNAIISAARQELQGSTLYLVGIDPKTNRFVDAKPCNICDRMIRNAGIKTVVSVNGGGLKNENGAGNPI